MSAGLLSAALSSPPQMLDTSDKMSHSKMNEKINLPINKQLGSLPRLREFSAYVVSVQTDSGILSRPGFREGEGEEREETWREKRLFFSFGMVIG